MFITQEIKTKIGTKTKVYSYPGNADTHILILPGNPGVGVLYQDFAEKIYLKFEKTANVHILTYAGFELEETNSYCDLYSQLNHKIEIFQLLSSTWNSNARIILVGHSIGAWITIEMHKKLKSNFQMELHLLFPFIAKSNTKIQDQIAGFFTNENYTKLANMMYRFLGKLPAQAISILLLVFYSHASEKSRTIITDYLQKNKRFFEHVFNLAKDEFNKLNDDIDFDYFLENSKSIFLYYCSNDLWAPLNQLEILQKKVPDLNGIIIPMITHDFCVNQEQSELVALKVIENIRKDHSVEMN